MKIRKVKSRAKLCVSCLLALVCVVGIVISAYKIIEWKIDSDRTKSQEKEVQTIAEVTEKEDDQKTEVVKQEKPDPKTGPYWDYIKMKLIDVDFTELKQKNSETVSWISVSGTNINYPVVQTTNNDFYLNHTFDRSYNEAGWVFADFRNSVDGNDKNMIFYAHGRIDGTMFGTLRNILTSGWLNNVSNYTVRTSNEHENALWQVFSVYHIPTTSDYIQTSFLSDEEFQKFTNMLMKRSSFNFHTNVTGADHIMTLSTCYSETERVVLHAKLIKRSAKN
ncbi:class B sortase [Candidatus Saccharibacteria bacterium]|nr:class B sortase [Candidatus Saccharibacteria bacterium]